MPYYCLSVALAAGNTPPDNRWPGSAVAGIGQLFSLILILVFVLVLAYYATRFMGSTRAFRKGTGNLEIIEGLSIGPHQCIQIIRAGASYFIVAISKDKVEFLTEIEKDTLDLMPKATDVAKLPFEKYLSRYMPQNQQTPTETPREGIPADEDDTDENNYSDLSK